VKNYKLKKEQIRPLAEGHGSCIASDKITVEGYAVRFMYRERPDDSIDSGWRFMSGYEDDNYMNDPKNLAIYDVNTIANYDSGIIPFLHSPVGSAFEKPDGYTEFIKVDDWQPPSE
jgi:hypothetical protein